jgi:formate hydrogenlyase subunit 3/multisubunit Na+/H+ antiporter MnhD subunit
MAVSLTFMNGTATILVILFLLGLYGLIKLNNTARLIAIVAIIGVLFVNIPFIQTLGETFREWVGSGLTKLFNAPAFVADQAFSLLMIVFIIVGYSLHMKNQRKDNDDQHKWWMTLVVISSIMLFTVGWANNLVDGLGERSAQLLQLISQLHL